MQEMQETQVLSLGQEDPLEEISQTWLNTYQQQQQDIVYKGVPLLLSTRRDQS